MVPATSILLGNIHNLIWLKELALHHLHQQINAPHAIQLLSNVLNVTVTLVVLATESKHAKKNVLHLHLQKECSNVTGAQSTHNACQMTKDQ